MKETAMTRTKENESLERWKRDTMLHTMQRTRMKDRNSSEEFAVQTVRVFVHTQLFT